MKKVIMFLFVAILFAHCEGASEDVLKEVCSTPATVRDLTGLDGCGFVFELEDGTWLEPLRIIRCGTTDSLSRVTVDPLYDFEFVDGKEVFISYELENNYASECMVGPIVKITCLKEAPTIFNE